MILTFWSKNILVKVTSKGQVTIPQGIRERSGITCGTEIDFVIRGDEVVISKKKEEQSQIDSWLEEVAGCGTSGLSTDKILEITRGEN